MEFPNLIAGLNFYLGLLYIGSILGNSWFSNLFYKTFIL